MKNEQLTKIILAVFLSFIIMFGCGMTEKNIYTEREKKIETKIKDEKYMTINLEGKIDEKEDNKVNSTNMITIKDYALLLNTEIKFGASLRYHRYGIYGDFIESFGEAEKLYFDLCSKLLGTKLCLKETIEWAFNNHPHIQNLSPDLGWVVSRQYLNEAMLESYIDRVYHKNSLYMESEGEEYIEHFKYLFSGEKETGFNILSQEIMNFRKKLIDELWEGNIVIDRVCSIDSKGMLLAVSAQETNDIQIYSLGDCKKLYHFSLEELDGDFNVEISQIEGSKEEGWIIFSNGRNTWKMEFPSGNIEKLGEFMYGAKFSPDGCYMAYCTGSELLLEQCRMIQDKKPQKVENLSEEWGMIPKGWYIKNVETGEKTYIPVETDGEHIYSGYCTWIEKEKLLEILEIEESKK